MENIHKRKICLHCPQNPKATKPLDPMKKLSIATYVYDKIVSEGKNPACLICETVNEIIHAFKGKRTVHKADIETLIKSH